jgi:hypothetical protein
MQLSIHLLLLRLLEHEKHAVGDSETTKEVNCSNQDGNQSKVDADEVVSVGKLWHVGTVQLVA